MVRTTLGAEVETTVNVAGSESVDIINLDQTGTVPDGDSESVVLRAPSGFIFEVLTARLQARPTGSTATGDHFLQVKSEVQFITVGSGRSSGDNGIQYQNSYWRRFNQQAGPESPGDQTAALRGIRFDDTFGLELRYRNVSGVDQTNKRQYRLWVRKIQVGE